jgi:hypothetical protein
MSKHVTVSYMLLHDRCVLKLVRTRIDTSLPICGARSTCKERIVMSGYQYGLPNRTTCMVTISTTSVPF